MIDIDHHGNAAPDRLGAEIGAKRRATALGEDGVAIFQKCVRCGQFHPPQFRIAERDNGALARRINHDAGDRSHQALHMHDAAGVDPLMSHLLEDVAARGFIGIAHRPAD